MRPVGMPSAAANADVYPSRSDAFTSATDIADTDLQRKFTALVLLFGAAGANDVLLLSSAVAAVVLLTDGVVVVLLAVLTGGAVVVLLAGGVVSVVLTGGVVVVLTGGVVVVLRAPVVLLLADRVLLHAFLVVGVGVVGCAVVLLLDTVVLRLGALVVLLLDTALVGPGAIATLSMHTPSFRVYIELQSYVQALEPAGELATRFGSLDMQIEHRPPWMENMPAGHCSHVLMAGSPRWYPPWHWNVHVVLSAVLTYTEFRGPAPHAVGWAVPVPAHLNPEGQTKQLPAPVKGAYDPAGQSVHARARTPPLYFPAEHVAQFPSSVALVP
jgi:hypothetical protein